MAISVGAVVRAEAGGGKRRPCVVLRLRLGDGALVVLAGTGTPRDLPRVVVEAGTRAWKAMRLDKDTYFYLPPLAFAEAEVEPTGGVCPPNKLQEMRELVGNVDPPG